MVWDGIERRSCLKVNGNLVRLRELTMGLSSLHPKTNEGVTEYETERGVVKVNGLFKNKDCGIILFFFQAGTIMKPHLHPMKEWLGVYQGELKKEIDNKVYSFKPYEVCVLEPNVVHKVFCDIDTYGWAITMPADEGYADGKFKWMD